MSYVDLISTTEEMRQMLSDETSRKLGHASLGFVTFHEVESIYIYINIYIYIYISIAARQALLYYNNPQNTIIHKGNKISVSKAPEAYEIIWENLSCSHIERYSRIFMTCIICLLIILLTCIFNFYLGMLIVYIYIYILERTYQRAHRRICRENFSSISNSKRKCFPVKDHG